MGLATKEIRKEFADNLRPLFVSILVGLIVHFWLYSHGFLNPDSLWAGKFYISTEWESTLGRWGIVFFDYLFGGLNAPYLVAVILIFAFSLSGVLLNVLFRVRGLAIKILVPCLLVTSPMAACLMTYYFCAAEYAISFLLAILAVFVAVKIGNSKYAVLCGALCLMISLSIYQSGLGVAVILCVSVLIPCMKEKGLHCFLQRTLRLAGMGLIGVVGYYAVLKIVLYLNGWEMASYRGADKIGLIYVLSNLGKGIQNAFSDFGSYFWGNTLMINSYHVSDFYVGIFLIFAVAVVMWAYRYILSADSAPWKWIKAIILAMLLAVSPIACNIMDLAAPDTLIDLRTCGGMVIVVPLMLIFVKNSLPFGEGKQKYIYYLVCTLSFCLVWSFTLINNTDALLMERIEHSSELLANRVCSQIENNEFYSSGSKVLIIGIPRKGNYADVSDALSDNANPYASLGLFWEDNAGTYNCWWQLFYQKLGLILNWDSLEKYNEIAATSEFLSMPCYPHNGSMKVIDDVLVVKMSDMNIS